MIEIDATGHVGAARFRIEHDASRREFQHLALLLADPDILADRVLLLQVVRADQVGHQRPGAEPERNGHAAQNRADDDGDDDDREGDVDADLVNTDNDRSQERRPLRRGADQLALTDTDGRQGHRQQITNGGADQVADQDNKATAQEMRQVGDDTLEPGRKRMELGNVGSDG